MKLNKKTIIIIFVVLLCVILICMSLNSFIKYGNVLIGSGWVNSPEQVFEEALKSGYYNRMDNQKQDSLKIKTLIDILEFENEIYYVYISEGNTFCVMNIAHDVKKDLWHESALYVYVYDEDVEITSEYEYCLWEHELFISSDETIVFGFMESGIAESYYVNDTEANVKSYTFEVHGKKYSVDYWYVSDLPKGTNFDSLDVYYTEHKHIE